MRHDILITLPSSLLDEDAIRLPIRGTREYHVQAIALGWTSDQAGITRSAAVHASGKLISARDRWCHTKEEVARWWPLLGNKLNPVSLPPVPIREVILDDGLVPGLPLAVYNMLNDPEIFRLQAEHDGAKVVAR